MLRGVGQLLDELRLTRRRLAENGARAHIGPGRDGLFGLVKSLPPTLEYEPGVIVAEGEFVIVHGRFSKFGQPANWIAADILRVKDGLLVEHWDVIQDEASREQSRSRLPMFGDEFPK